MTPYSVLIHRHDIGKRQCCLKAADAEAARHRIKTRTYPGCTVLEVKRREISPPGKIGATPSRVSNAKANLVKAQAVQRATRQEKIEEVARLVAAGVSTVSQIAARIGHPYSTTCKYVNAAADQGKIVALYTGQGQTAVLKVVQ